MQFDQPIWLALAPVCCALVVWIGRKSLSGMGTAARRVALVIRLLVVLMLVCVVARPHWRREGKNVSVAVIVDESDSVRLQPRSVGGQQIDYETFVNMYLQDAAPTAKPGDTLARLSVGRKAVVQSLPVAPRDQVDTGNRGATDGTNLAEAINLALAVPATDRSGQAAAKRILLVSDGVETAGDLWSAALAAKAAGVPIDVRPITYSFSSEVRVERVVAPSTARVGQTATLRVIVSSLKPASGRLSLLINGEAVRLGAESGPDAWMDMPVRLEAGTNVVPIPVTLPLAGPQRFEAVFTPDDPKMDSIRENNRSMAVTFVQSEGRVLVLAPRAEEVAPLVKALTEAKLSVDVRLPLQAPTSLVDWGAFDAVLMANVPGFDFSQQQQEDIKSYVQDLGGGLLMVGGPEAFGAGGWLGSPVADALPVRLDPPQQRKMPRGALVLLMHSCEMPQGNYWGAQVAQAAVNNLSRLDLAGVLEFSWNSGDQWVHPLSEVGNKAAISRAIASLTFGDMPSFDNLLQMAYTALVKADAGAKHVIIISDGDPRLMNLGLLSQFAANRISISTVLVYPHSRGAGGPDWSLMKEIADRTKGRFHPVIDEGEFATLPSIFIKEAQTVKRALIWEGQPFVPTISNAVSEPMRGLTSGGLPPVSGYIVTGEREGLSIVTLRGKENDPLLAHWQFGLGKSVALTTDSGARWSTQWPSWGKYRAFWEQHVRWAMRPGGAADMRVVTEDMGDRTRVIVEALDETGERLNFVRFSGRVVGPGNQSQALELRQVGPGRYEGVFESGQSGAYVSNLRYRVRDPKGGAPREGNLQSAVTRPYAEEFKSLKDNQTLLKQIAEVTGGRVVNDDPKQAALWDRTGLKMPVDLRPIWLQLALASLGVFLVDVAVRRVRIEPALIMAAIRKGLGQGAQKSNQQMGSLKEARGRARAEMAQRAAQDTAQVARGGRSGPGPSTGASSGAGADVKFEAGADELKGARTNMGIESGKPTGAPPARAQGPGADTPAADGEGGLSRLKKARQRAQDKFEDEGPGPERGSQ